MEAPGVNCGRPGVLHGTTGWLISSKNNRNRFVVLAFIANYRTYIERNCYNFYLPGVGALTEEEDVEAPGVNC